MGKVKGVSTHLCLDKEQITEMTQIGFGLRML